MAPWGILSIAALMLLLPLAAADTSVSTHAAGYAQCGEPAYRDPASPVDVDVCVVPGWKDGSGNDEGWIIIHYQLCHDDNSIGCDRSVIGVEGPVVPSEVSSGAICSPAWPASPVVSACVESDTSTQCTWDLVACNPCTFAASDVSTLLYHVSQKVVRCGDPPTLA
jgi:hypothetical protein